MFYSNRDTPLALNQQGRIKRMDVLGSDIFAFFSRAGVFDLLLGKPLA
jgi:hypothetical protein